MLKTLSCPILYDDGQIEAHATIGGEHGSNGGCRA